MTPAVGGGPGQGGRAGPAAQLALDFSAPATVAAPPPGVGSTAAPAVPRHQIVRSGRRRTLGFEVHRDLRVVVRAPLRCDEAMIEHHLAQHRVWIVRQLDRFRALAPPPPPPRHFTGEEHLYRGRALRLRVEPRVRTRVALEDGELVVRGSRLGDPSMVAVALSRWYRAEAAREFAHALQRCHAHPRFAEYPLPTLHLRRMRSRWGTLCTRRGMTLNTVLIQAPAACLEYVIFHELCHLVYRGHGPRFHRLMDRVLPDWKARKQLLESVITW